MLFKICSCSESLSAFFALEGFITSVDFLVSFKIGNLIRFNDKILVGIYLSEGFVAIWMSALIWLLPSVNSEVFLERRILGERLSTSY